MLIRRRLSPMAGQVEDCGLVGAGKGSASGAIRSILMASSYAGLAAVDRENPNAARQEPVGHRGNSLRNAANASGPATVSIMPS